MTDDDPEVPASVTQPGACGDARTGGVVARVGLVIGPAVFLILLAMPMPGLDRRAHVLLAIFAWTVVYWVTEALPVAATALMSSALAIVLGVAPAATVLGAYGDPVVFLFIGSFMLAEAMRASGLDRRFAFALLRPRWATLGPGRLMLGMAVAVCALSLWISNTATTAIMLPVGLGLLRAIESGTGPSGRFAVGFLLMLTWASSVAVGVPVGSPPNLIAIGLLRELGGRHLTFFDWMAVAMPLTVAMLGLCWLILYWRYGGGAFPAAGLGAWIEAEREALGPWTTAQRNVVGVFVLACLLWILPGAVAVVSSPEAALSRWLERHVPEAVVALGAAVLLFALPTDWRQGHFTLGWREATRIDWGTIILFGGGLALGKLMFDTGLAEAIGRALLALTGAETVWGITAVAIAAGIVLSEGASNTASASMLVPVMIAVAQDAGVSPIPPALGAALGASFGFMLPVSTPPNAIVYGSRLVPLRDMITSGAVLDVAGGILIWLGLRTLCPLFGLL